MRPIYEGYDQRAVDFDWRSWIPRPDEIVRVLSHEEIVSRNNGESIFDPLPPRHSLVSATEWYVVEVADRIVKLNAYPSYSSYHRLSLCYYLPLDALVPLSVFQTNGFRDFVKRTKQEVEGK